MKMKVVIANPDKDNLDKIKQAFDEQQKYEIIGATEDGAEVIKLAHEMTPDMVIANVFLPHVDGITASDIIKSENPNILMVMTSPIGLESFIIDAFCAGKIDYYLISSVYTVENFVQQVDNAVRIYENRTSYIRKPSLVFADVNDLDDIEIERKITDFMVKLGLKPNLSGFKLIRLAIIMILKNPDVLNHVTKSLYPKLAMETNSTSTRVERAIRHCVEKLFDNKANYEAVDELF